MAYKFCENHLTELYEAVKANDITLIEKIEHELSAEEECIACTYALKAKGETKEVLVNYLRSEGLITDTKKTFLNHLATISLVLVIVLSLIAVFYLFFHKISNPTLLVIITPLVGATLFFFLTEILEK